MARQYYCWRVALTYRCGCTETTHTAHSCGPRRDGCTSWQTNRRSDKNCERHRLGGLHLHRAGGHPSDADAEAEADSGSGSGSGSGVSSGSREDASPGEGGRRCGGEGRAGEGQGQGQYEGYYLRRRVV
ncbi:hypothetical protein BT67DRAFT_434465 [Trichocladium antarcticum]|uniref:Uncharacterized protein n=1 Tax=Trichocladium antarcticum TaxID=1450529 RepID=A0AAN6UK65_9PEZI|nr:hypothetical protein BT67DRAFT_434465 [Trichocladium antarcticum]